MNNKTLAEYGVEECAEGFVAWARVKTQFLITKEFSTKIQALNELKEKVDPMGWVLRVLRKEPGFVQYLEFESEVDV